MRISDWSSDVCSSDLLFGDIDDGSKLVAALVGRSDLTANFGTGALAASLFPTRVTADGVSTALGRYDFSGVIDAYSAAFTGAWKSGPGSLAGRFDGHAASEYAGVFNTKDTAAGNMEGGPNGKKQRTEKAHVGKRRVIKVRN